MISFLRFAGAGALALIIWLTLAADGWQQIAREPLIPQPVGGMVGIGIPLTPGEPGPVLATDRDLDVTVEVDRPDTNEILVRINYRDSSDTIPEEPFVLTLSGALASADVTCESAQSQVRTGQTFDELSTLGRSLSVRELAQRDTDADESTRRSALEIAKDAKLETFLEVSLTPEIETSWYDPDVPTSSSNAQTETYTVREDKLRLSEACAIRSRGLWTVSGPERRMNLPSVIVAELDEDSDISTTVTTDLSVDPDTTVIRNLTQPSSQGLPSVQWVTSTSGNGSQGFYSGTVFSDDAEFLVTSDLSTVLSSSVEAQSAQSQIFLSGIGLGVMASLLVWMASELFNGGVWAAGKLSANRRETSSEGADETPEAP